MNSLLISKKHFVFLFLFILLIFYSVIVYTFGTATDSGKEYITKEAGKGKLLFQKNNCIACHQIYGLGGNMGTDLTNVFSRNGEKQTRAILQSGTKRMPDFHLSDQEISELLAYLKYIDKTGTYPITRFKLKWYGTIITEN